MKRFLSIAVLLGSLALTAAAQKAPEKEKYVRRANYGLAERFSQKKISQMVYSTRISPNWFVGSDKF